MKIWNKKTIYIFGIMCVYCSLLVSCKHDNKKEPHQGINPFDTTMGQEQRLSELDSAKLGDALGKSAQAISPEEILLKSQDINSKVLAFCFWDLQHGNTARALAKVAANYDNKKLKVFYVNVGDKNPHDVNVFIRTYSLADDNYMIEAKDMAFVTQIRKNFTNTTLPALLITNLSDESIVYYNQEFDEKALDDLLKKMINP